MQSSKLCSADKLTKASAEQELASCMQSVVKLQALWESGKFQNNEELALAYARGLTNLSSEQSLEDCMVGMLVQVLVQLKLEFQINIQMLQKKLPNFCHCLLALILFVIGIVLVVKGGDIFVDAASWIAKAAGIPTFIVGATIVSLATTMPELLVSVFAAADGKIDMARKTVKP